MRVGSSAKIPTTPKKNKGKEKILEPIMESPKHINFHSFSKLNGDVHSLILLPNGPMKGKGGKQARMELLELTQGDDKGSLATYV